MTPTAHLARIRHTPPRKVPRRPSNAVGALLAALLWLPAQAGADLPATATLLTDLGLSGDEIAQVEAGQLIRRDVPTASDRELTTGIVYEVPLPPTQLIQNSERDLMDAVDATMISHGTLSNPAAAADLASLKLEPKAEERAKAYVEAKPGGDLYLSKAEMASFNALGRGASTATVEAAVRAALLARVQAYQKRGLAGIAPYSFGDGVERSAAAELETATKAAQKLEEYAPAAYRYLLSYPEGKPAGTREIFRWSQFEAHGVPTITLTHLVLIPDGAAWIAAKRQFYVSGGYNAEQGIAAFVPTKAGTVMIYANRTSTDQVTGWGGGAKRSIGSRLLASQLEDIFEKAAQKAH